MSVPTNIAEGNSKKSKKEQSYFLEIALASLDELHYQCLLSADLGYILKTDCDVLHQHMLRIGYLTHRLQESLSRRS